MKYAWFKRHQDDLYGFTMAMAPGTKGVKDAQEWLRPHARPL